MLVSKASEGLDFLAPTGTPIYPIANGRVTKKSFMKNGYGYYLSIDHGNGYTSLYGHNNSTEPRNITVGTYVDTNTIIAYVGSTGFSDSPHLHLNIDYKGKHTNPYPYIFEDLIIPNLNTTKLNIDYSLLSSNNIITLEQNKDYKKVLIQNGNLTKEQEILFNCYNPNLPKEKVIETSDINNNGDTTIDEEETEFNILSITNQRNNIDINLLNIYRKQTEDILNIYQDYFDLCNYKNVEELKRNRYGYFEIEDMARKILKACNPDYLDLNENINNYFNKINYDTKTLDYNTNTIEGALLYNLQLIKNKYDNPINNVNSWLNQNVRDYVVQSLGMSLSLACTMATGGAVLFGCGAVGAYYTSLTNNLINYTSGKTDTLDFGQINIDTLIGGLTEFAFGKALSFLWKGSKWIWGGGKVIPHPVKSVFNQLDGKFYPIKNNVDEFITGYQKANGKYKEVAINNKSLKNALQSESSGDWVKVFEGGYKNSKPVEIHYFKNKNTGEVFDVKVKYEYWNQKEFN